MYGVARGAGVTRGRSLNGIAPAARLRSNVGLAAIPPPACGRAVGGGHLGLAVKALSAVGCPPPGDQPLGTGLRFTSALDSTSVLDSTSALDSTRALDSTGALDSLGTSRLQACASQVHSTPRPLWDIVKRAVCWVRCALWLSRCGVRFESAVKVWYAL